MGLDLSLQQRQECMELVDRNQDVFSVKPGTTHLAVHEIRTKPGKIINQRPYRVPEAHKETI